MGWVALAAATTTPPGRRPGCRGAVEQQTEDDDRRHRNVQISPVLKMIACSTTPSPMRPRRCAEVVHAPDTTAASAHGTGIAQRASDGEVGDAGPQEDRDESEHRRDHPHRCLHATDRNAERGCPVGAFGRGPDRDADTRVAHEERERDQDDRDDEEDHQVVRVEEDAADVHLDVERRVERGPVEVLEPEPARHEQRGR